jgi:hypothetical protein
MTDKLDEIKTGTNASKRMLFHQHLMIHDQETAILNILRRSSDIYVYRHDLGHVLNLHGSMHAGLGFVS